MVAFGHTAIGTAVGLYGIQTFSSGDPLEGLIKTTALGITSHYLADLIPHGHFIKFKDFQKKVFQVILFDLGLSVLIFTSLAYYKFGFDQRFLYILFGIGGSQLPDIVDGLIYIKKLPNKGLLKLENNIHTLTHWHGKKEKSLMWGKRDIWQVIVLAASALFLLSF